MKRSLQLDVLRGVAILLVVGAHLARVPTPTGIVGAFADFWKLIGPIGVDLFFVLSGFLIGGLLLVEHRKHGEIRPWRFLVRRGLKIYPLYFMFLAYLIAMPTAKALVDGGDVWGELAAGVEKYWPNVLFVHMYVGGNPIAHTWSLATEEHFYLALPFLLLLLARKGAMQRLLPICFVVVPLATLLIRSISLALGDEVYDVLYQTQNRLDALMFGVGIRAVAEWHPKLFAFMGRYRWALLVFGVLCWSPMWAMPVGPLWYVCAPTVIFVGSAAILMSALHSSMQNRVARVVAWVGFYSYAIYLWHVTAMGISDRLIGAPIASGLDPSLAWLLRVAVIVVSVCIAGSVISRLVEIPVLKLRDRWFPADRQARPAPPVGQLADA